MTNHRSCLQYLPQFIRTSSDSVCDPATKVSVLNIERAPHDNCPKEFKNDLQCTIDYLVLFPWGPVIK